MQGMPQGLSPALQHALAQGQGMGMNHSLDSLIPLLPSFSLDSFFAGCEAGNAAAARAQAPPPMMENVLPAWEDLSNKPSGSLQTGADWRVR